MAATWSSLLAPTQPDSNEEGGAQMNMSAAAPPAEESKWRRHHTPRTPEELAQRALAIAELEARANGLPAPVPQKLPRKEGEEGGEGGEGTCLTACETLPPTRTNRVVARVWVDVTSCGSGTFMITDDDDDDEDDDDDDDDDDDSFEKLI